MAANKKYTGGPIALTTTTTTNILNPGTAALAVAPTNSTAVSTVYVLLNHIRVVNKTAGAVTVSLWKGLTGGNAAGTEFLWIGTSVPANSFVEAFGEWRFDSVDFLVGGAGTATALSIEFEGEVGIA